MIYRLFLKRCIDIVASALAIVVLLPIYLIISLVLFAQTKKSPFFVQKRPGKDQKPIAVIKFKSMTDERDNQGVLLPDDQRITRFGSFIRNTSLDELPQLFNVLKGDMSLVGPRPLLYKYIPLYSAEQLRRHEIRPGITGWAQVNGRNQISWTKKFELDIHYIDNVSFVLDIKILLLTVLKVVRREGINQNELRPMEPFNGQN